MEADVPCILSRKRSKSHQEGFVFRIFNRYVSAKSALLMVIESSLIMLSVVAAAKLRFWADSDEFLIYTRGTAFLLQILTVSVTLEMCLYYNDLYDLSTSRTRSMQAIHLIQAIGAGCILLGLIYYLVPGLLVGKGVLFISVALVTATLAFTRAALDHVWSLTARQTNVLILGDGELALSVAREFERRSDLNFRLAGFIGAQINAESSLFGRPVLGGTDNLAAIASRENASRIVVALQDQRGALPVRDLVRLRVQGIEVEDAHSTLAALTGRVWLPAVRPSWFVFSSGFRRSAITLLLKRSLDLALGIVGLVLFGPIMAIIAIAIHLDSRGPALFRQERVGLGGKVFDLLKFRSMRLDAEAGSGAQWARKDDVRVTRVGRFLRKYRLDEVPQFINVIRGEMSFVGPRPERPCFVDQLREMVPFSDERHSVRPGVPGWAHVEFKSGASIEDSYRKLEYDLFYLKNMSLLFDLVIVVRTFRVVFLARGSR
jgi:sugar transferase (PEP-CTERM system associated)